MEKVISFYLEDDFFGIDLTAVKEINRHIFYTVVPGSPENVIGIINLRGQIITLIDLALIMSYGPSDDISKKTCIILKSNSGEQDNRVGFIIDRAGDVLDIPSEICESPPANCEGIKGVYIKKVARLEGSLLMIIDEKKILESQIQ